MSGDTAVEAQLIAREEGGVLWLTLDRPEAGNALTPAQRDRLVGLLQEASARVATRVVVLTATSFPELVVRQLPHMPKRLN